MNPQPSPSPTLNLDQKSTDACPSSLCGYGLCPREYSLHPDKDNDPNTSQSQTAGSCEPIDYFTLFNDCSTKMTTTSLFEVPKFWQTAMSIVSVNAGLFPQEVLTQYQRQQPIQKLHSPDCTELDMTGSKRATSRGIKAVTIRYADNDPGNIYLMVIFVDEIDPNTKRNVVRLITNTSIKHVLEAEPGANCPLWLRVHSEVTHASSRYQIIPCCEHWIDDLDFKRPISKEEKQIPAVVERLMEELTRKDLLLAEKDREVQDRDDELARLRNHPHLGEVVAAPATEHVLHQPSSDIEALIQQYWLVGVTAIAILIALFTLT